MKISRHKSLGLPSSLSPSFSVPYKKISLSIIVSLLCLNAGAAFAIGENSVYTGGGATNDPTGAGSNSVYTDQHGGSYNAINVYQVSNGDGSSDANRNLAGTSGTALTQTGNSNVLFIGQVQAGTNISVPSAPNSSWSSDGNITGLGVTNNVVHANQSASGGSGATATVWQKSSGNTASVTQSGNGSIANVTQGSAGGGEAIVNQSGNSAKEIDITQTGTGGGSLASVTQSGTGVHLATINQSPTNTDTDSATITQSGNGNAHTAAITQEQYNGSATATVIQSGTVASGPGHVMTIDQYGSDPNARTVVATQSGTSAQTLTYYQTGGTTGGEYNVTQDGGPGRIIVSQSGGTFSGHQSDAAGGGIYVGASTKQGSLDGTNSLAGGTLTINQTGNSQVAVVDNMNSTGSLTINQAANGTPLAVQDTPSSFVDGVHVTNMEGAANVTLNQNAGANYSTITLNQNAGSAGTVTVNQNAAYENVTLNGAGTAGFTGTFNTTGTSASHFTAVAKY